MTNGYSNLKPSISVEASPIYSASIASSGVSPVISVIISELPEKEFDLSVSIVGKSAGTVFIQTGERNFERTCTDTYDRQGKNRLIIRFEQGDFEINREYLYNIESAQIASLTAKVTIGIKEYQAETEIKLAPAYEWQGIEYHPESLASYICSAKSGVAELAAPAKEIQEREQKLRALVKNIRAKNIICAARDSYSPERRQSIKSHDVLLARGTVVATPMELAVLFCACAEYLDLLPVLVFSTNMTGNVSMFCGVRSSRCSVTSAVFESLSALRGAIQKGEIALFDPALLASAQNMDPVMACQLAGEYFKKLTTRLVLGIDIENSRLSGVSPMYAEKNGSNKTTAAPKDTLAKIYANLSENRILDMLAGVYTCWDIIPLLGKLESDSPYCNVSDKEAVRTIKPLEISDKISAFAGISDNFASFALREEKSSSYNKSEMEAVSLKYANFREKISQKSCEIAGLYEKKFHETASRMCFGNTKENQNYMICGFMRITRRETRNTRYLPLAFYKVKLWKEYDYFYSFVSDQPVINTVLVNYLSGSALHKEFAGCKTPSDVFMQFENLASFARKKHQAEFSDVCVIYERALIKADFSEYILRNDIKAHASKMLKNSNYELILAKGAKSNPANRENKADDVDAGQKNSSERAYVRFAPKHIKNILQNSDNCVITGSSVKEKIDVAVNRAALSFSNGETVLVASENDEFLECVRKELEISGLSEAVICLNKYGSTDELVKAMLERIEKAEQWERNASAPEMLSSEFSDIADKLKKYGNALTAPDKDVCISPIDAAASYYSAAGECDGMYLLDVEKSAFEEFTAAKLNKLFELAEKLINTCSSAMISAGMSESQPLKTHPLFALSPEKMPEREELSQASDLIYRILPVLSEYRETFLDISDKLGFSINELSNAGNLLALNELYRLIISARELDIPSDFEKSDIHSFADGTGEFQRNKNRMEAIEYQLRFFSPEIFEDVGAILSGNEAPAREQSGFLKRFLVKMNGKDVLLQYITPENRMEFAKHDVSEIYRLLGEYRDLKNYMNSGKNNSNTDENSVKLAELVKNISSTLAEISPQKANNKNWLNRVITNVFKFISFVESDASVSKKLTYTRARFAQVYSENECMLDKLSNLLGADFVHIEFENGVLNYDGLSAYLRKVEENLPSLPEWMKWLEAKNKAYDSLSSFCEYLENHGAGGDTDRIFAASLLLPATEYLIRKNKFDENYDSVNRAKFKYRELITRTAALAAVNAIDAYKQRLKHYLETENVSSVSDDAGLSIGEFILKHKAKLFRLFPCVIVNSRDTGIYFGGECVADHLIACDEGESGMLNTGIMSCAKKVMMLSFGPTPGFAAQMLLDAGVTRADVSYHIYPLNRKLAACFGDGKFYNMPEDASTISSITVNGYMRCSTDLANPAEAETCVSKAVELTGKSDGRVAIFCFTHGQYAYIRHLLCIGAENDKKVKELLEQQKICVRSVNDISFEQYENVIVSFAAAPDKEGTPCRSSGLGNDRQIRSAMLNIANACAGGDTIFVTSLSLKECADFAKKALGTAQMYMALLFSASKVIPISIADSKSFENPLSRHLLSTYKDAFPAKGIYDCATEAAVCDDGRIVMYDCSGSDDILDRLAVCEMIERSGTKCECVSPLETVLKEVKGKK